jgi:hypothetical protein
MQTSTATVWKVVRKLLVVAVAGYGVLALLSIYVFQIHYPYCKEQTKYLNGGERVYAGRKFKIVLCGTGGDENFNHDRIRMQIFSDSGSLLAERKFYVDWNGVGPFKLAYTDDHLIYADLSYENDYKRKVSMPPTWLDWIRARLPLMD